MLLPTAYSNGGAPIPAHTCPARPLSCSQGDLSIAMPASLVSVSMKTMSKQWQT